MYCTVEHTAEPYRASYCGSTLWRNCWWMQEIILKWVKKMLAQLNASLFSFLLFFKHKMSFFWASKHWGWNSFKSICWTEGLVLKTPVLALNLQYHRHYCAIENQDAVAYVNARLTDPHLMAITHTEGLINVLRITVFIFFITRKTGSFLSHASCFLLQSWWLAN